MRNMNEKNPVGSFGQLQDVPQAKSLWSVEDARDLQRKVNTGSAMKPGLSPDAKPQYQYTSPVTNFN